ncbi:hypothetical protein J4P91_10815 [Bacillus sp. XF8]|nr:hypothetical protein [Bacillus sp. XF8]
MNISLSAEYKVLLSEYSKYVLKDNFYFRVPEKWPWISEDGYEEVEIFYGLNSSEIDLRVKIEQYDILITWGMIPIGNLPGENQLCLGIKGEGKDKIFIWDYEGLMN